MTQNDKVFSYKKVYAIIVSLEEDILCLEKIKKQL